MRRKPAPQMTAEEFRKKIDFNEGDIVQIKGGKHAGRLAMIVSIGTYTNAKGFDGLTYNLRLSDSLGIRTTADHLTKVRRGEVD